MYWTEEDDLLVIQWQLRKTPYDEYRLYNALNPKIYYMVYNIYYRYFNQNTTFGKAMIDETRNHVFLQLDKFDSSKSKAYSFIGAVAKNYIDNLYYSVYSRDTDFDYEIREEDKTYTINMFEQDYLEKLINYLDRKVAEVREEYEIEFNNQFNIKNRNRRKFTFLKSKIRVGELIKEYFEKYEFYNFEMANVLEYILNNDDIAPNTAYRHLKHYLKQGSTYQLWGKEVSEYSPSEKKWIKQIGKLNHDACPNTNKNNFQISISNIKKSIIYNPSPF